MDQRNRATGWQHAKLSGHSNEEAIKMLLSQDINEQKLFLSRLGKNNATITNIDVGGLNERDVKRAISLFWGSAEDTLDIVEKHSSEKIKAYEKRKHRLVADSILKYDEHLYHTLISWFVENSYEIADFCFSKGLAKNQKDWANWIWYKNLIGEHEVDKLFSIESICALMRKIAIHETYYGNRGGGTTIQLPFGFVQWHQGQMQFHHSFDKINNLK